MNIILATSDLYSRPAIVTLQSLMMNNTHVKELSIFYIENNISGENKRLITDLADKFGRSVVFIKMPEYLRNISGFMRTDVITYSYCYFQDIIPSAVDKALLIESDTIVLGSISELYETDISDHYLAAADDCQSKYCKEKVGIQVSSPYFNAGVLLLNLKKMREDGISGKITEIIESGKSKFMYEVQDEMNVCFEGKVKILPPRFNCTTSIFLFSYKNMFRYRWPSTSCSKQEFDEARSKPLIVHFTKNQIVQSRPWIQDCQHPYKEEYLRIKEQTEIANEPLWESDRKTTNKIVNFIYSKISQTVVAMALGFIHAYAYPKFLYKYILRGG